MTTASAPASTAAPAYKLIAIADLHPNPQNPRRIDDKHPSLPSLAESIAAQGVLEPLLVRDLDGVGMRYEILAGERRWRAARIAGVKAVPCLVHDCDDQRAFEITVTENLQREGLHWLEEARGVELMVKKGWTAEVIAKQLGKSPSWVALRSKLSEMSPAWIKACADPENMAAELPVSKLELIARMPLGVQDEILENDLWDLRDDSPADIQRHIDSQYLHKLSAAPWELEDAALVPKAGACSACPKRSSCQASLFESVKGDSCLDQACWKVKNEAFAKRKLAELKKEAPAAVLVSSDYNGSKGVIGRSDYDLVKPGQKGATPAILMGDGKAPKLVHVVTGKGRTGQDTAREPSGDGKPKPPKERLAVFLKRRERAAISIVIKKLGGPEDNNSVNHWGQAKAPSADVTRPPRHVLCALAIAHGIKSNAWQGRDDVWPAYRKLVDTGDDGLDESLWSEVRQTVISQLIADKTYRVDQTGAKVMALAVGLPWTAIIQDIRDRMPLPKSLAEHFDENGLPLGKALAPKPEKPAKRKAYVKETASGAVREHLPDYPKLLKLKISAEGHSLASAAKVIGITVPTLRTAILGKTAPSMGTRRHLDNYLGIEAEEG